MKYEEQFRKEHPETVGEQEHAFDQMNYLEWCEVQIGIKDERIQELEDQVNASEILCRIYFNIGAKAVGEDEVRRIRDELLIALRNAKQENR